MDASRCIRSGSQPVKQLFAALAEEDPRDAAVEGKEF
jgi:hypothetical protein